MLIAKNRTTPVMPIREGVDVGKLMNVSWLALAAGPVGRDEQGNPRGLYREHCAHCHGITGDGVGPTATFLNPYPRDYRKGQFKFKSTPVGQKPNVGARNRRNTVIGKRNAVMKPPTEKRLHRSGSRNTSGSPVFSSA